MTRPDDALQEAALLARTLAAWRMAGPSAEIRILKRPESPYPSVRIMHGNEITASARPR